MKSFVHFAVVIVQIQAGCPQIHFVGLVHFSQASRQDCMNAGGKRRFVNGSWFVKIKVSAKGFLREIVLKNKHALQDIGLLDKTGAKDAVPRPVLVDGALFRWKIRGHDLLLFEVTILLQPNTQGVIRWQRDFFRLLLPIQGLGSVPTELDLGLFPQRRLLHANCLDHLEGVKPTIPGQVIGVPIVIDIVFVFVGTRNPVHHPGLAHLGPMNPLRPETSNPYHHLQPTLPPIRTVTGVSNVLIDSIDHGPVAVNLLKGDLPFVVALFAVHSHHGEQGRPVFEPQFAGIGNGFVQLTVTVLQQLPSNPRRGCSQIKGNAISLGIPVGRTPVLLAGETLGTNVQAMVQTVVGLMKVENVKSNALLSFDVAINLNISLFPHAFPGLGLFHAQFLVALMSDLLEYGIGSVLEFFG